MIFKNNDIVRITNLTGEQPVTIITIIKDIRDNDIAFTDINNNIYYLNYHLSEVKLWEPKSGEMCIFYNEHYTSLRIARFHMIARCKPRIGKFEDLQGNYFDNCKPYISNIVDKLIKILTKGLT